MTTAVCHTWPGLEAGTGAQRVGDNKGCDFCCSNCCFKGCGGSLAVVTLAASEQQAAFSVDATLTQLCLPLQSYGTTSYMRLLHPFNVVYTVKARPSWTTFGLFGEFFRDTLNGDS